MFQNSGSGCATAKLRHYRPAISSLIISMIVFAMTAPRPATAATLCVNHDGRAGCHSTIGSAVSAASPGDVIQIGPGIYKEQVTIGKSVSLIAVPALQATIDATNLPNAF